MKKAELERIKETERWPVRFSDVYKHYFFIIFPLCMSFVGFSALYSGIRNDVFDLKLGGAGIFLIGLILLSLTIKRLIQNHIFYKYDIDGLTVNTIISACKKAGFNDPKFYRKGYFQCTTGVSAFSWGESITIVLKKNCILINSRPNGQPITIFKDKKNLTKFVSELRISTANKTYSA